MAKLEVGLFDAGLLRKISDEVRDEFAGYLSELAMDIETACAGVSGEGTYEELPGADGEPDYCGLTFKQRPVA